MGGQVNMKEKNRDMRRIVFTSNALLLILIVVVLAVIVNLVAARFSYRLDTTKSKMYSLSDQSISALKELDKQKNELKIFGFYRTGEPNKVQVEDLLKEFKKRSDKISFKFSDPYKTPSEAKQYQVQELGTLVLTMGGKEMKILPRDLFEQQSENGPASFAGERALTRTIYKMIDADTKNIYLLQGHGEKDYPGAKNYITGEGYGVKALNLMKEGQIPADCSELIIAGPQGDLTAQEMKVIDDYMSQGGRLMVFLDFLPEKSRITNLIAFIQKWGVDAENSVVIETDQQRHTMFDYTTVVPTYQSHEITNKLQESNTSVLLPVNRALAKLKDYKGDASASVILESSPKSWAETNPRGQVKQDSNETKGPIPLGLAVTRPGATGKEGRLIVLGTSSFLENDFISQAGNLNLFFNMSSWLLGQEDRINIMPKQMDITRVTINPLQGNLIRWFVLLILPLILLATGGVIWFRRRAR
jgi:ABC-type uncharacterized transport system involved in gliding motility auxiliary subunit